MLRSAVGLVLLLGLAAPAALAQDAMPEGCSTTEAGALCRWSFDNRDDLTLFYAFDVPVFSRMLTTITVVHEGTDGGWELVLVDPEGDDFEDHRHTPSSQPSQVVRTSFQTLALMDENGTGALELRLNSDGVGVDGSSSFTGTNRGTPSVGAFTVTYLAERLPEGVAPSRPAATRDDPHLMGASLDARRGAYDLVAAWFDDAREGDGLFEAHVAVEDVTDWDWRQGGVAVVHRLWFQVLGVEYRLDWALVAADPVAAIEDVDVGCQLYRLTSATSEAQVLTPACAFDWEASGISALVPERAVGSPGDGALFTDMRALAVGRQQSSTTGYTSFLDTEEDALSGERYPFALGGPAVWDELNPRLAIPEPVVPAWYQAPLHRENVPDTLQVAGALVAVATFAFGFLVVRRHRRQTRELLARIDALMAQHARQAQAGLLALGALETEVSELYRTNRITDAQYQMLTQRIAGAATRFALRHGLGLDDGEPGDAATEVQR